MTDERDLLPELGTAACGICGELMMPEGDVREVDRGDGVPARNAGRRSDL